MILKKLQNAIVFILHFDYERDIIEKICAKWEEENETFD